MGPGTKRYYLNQCRIQVPTLETALWVELRKTKNDAIGITERVHLYIIYITLSLVISIANLFPAIYANLTFYFYLLVDLIGQDSVYKKMLCCH